MILYFTGTGNSRYAAEVIQSVTADEIMSINRYIKNGETGSVSTEKPLVFAAPVYAGRMPKVVSEFVENTEFSGCKKAYFLLTCSSGAGNSVKYIKDICGKKGFEFCGLAVVSMPNNHILMGASTDAEMAEKKIRQAEKRLLDIADKIKNQEKLSEERVSLGGKIASSLANKVFYSAIVKTKDFYVTDKCIGCGKCAALCPLNNISLTDKKPCWGNRCTHCTACINGCPCSAIEYGKRTQGKYRYFNTKHPKA